MYSPGILDVALVTDGQFLRGLEALRALDGRRVCDRAFYKLKNRFLDVLALVDDADVVTYVDGCTQ